MNHLGIITGSLAVAGLTLCGSARADIVTDWNAHWEKAAKIAGQAPAAEARAAAIVQLSVFEALNGIHRRYEPYLVDERAPHGAREEAAVALAAYTALVSLYPAQTNTFNAQLAESLASIPGHRGKSQSIARGAAWGEHVARLVIAARSLDGFSATVPNYFGGGAPGVWRSVPTGANADGTLPAVLPQLRYVVPFVINSPSQFRPGPPPALTSPEYAAAVNEVKDIGRVDSSTRTLEQTQLALLWQANTPPDLFHGMRGVLPDGINLLDEARLFALLAMAQFDAFASVYETKYYYNLWRPYHAIRLAGTDGNSATEVDAGWTSLIFPPRHQEYPSAHSGGTSAFLGVLAGVLGDELPFVLSSPGYTNLTWTFDRLSDAALQVQEARIWAGIHYRFSGVAGGVIGDAVADYVLRHALLPLREKPGKDAILHH